MMKLTVAIAAVALLFSSAVQAETVIFDLEDLPLTAIPAFGTVTTQSQVWIGGNPFPIGLTLEHFPYGSPVDSILEVEDLSGPLGGAWGNRSLSFFSNPGPPSGLQAFVSLIPDLSALPAGYGVAEIGWDMGDVEGTDLDLWSMFTFGVSGSPGEYWGKPSIDNLQGSLTPAGPQGFSYSTESQSRLYGIAFADLSAGSPEYRNSVYFDNFSLSIMPMDPGNGKIVGGSDLPNTDSGGGASNLPAATGPGRFPPAGGVVPLPSAAWLGLSLLGVLALGRRIRQRQSR